MTGMARLGGGAHRVALGLIIAASFGTAVGMLVGGPALCLGGNRRIANRTHRNRDVALSVVQSAKPDDACRGHATDGDPTERVRDRAAGRAHEQRWLPRHERRGGDPRHVHAPSSGASGVFSASGSNTVIVGADASGSVAAPTFIANTAAGRYTVTASSQYGSVSFSLTNTAAGVPARMVAIPLKRTSARIAGRFPETLQVRVLDAIGNPVAGTTVTFTIGTAIAGTCGTSTAASASFAGAGDQSTATTDASGLATSPALAANTAAGSFTATASVSGAGGSGSEGAGKAEAPSVTPVSFSLSNLAGKPTKIAPGVGSTQSTPAGSAFPIRLAVTVTDADKNPVPGALVTFSAPAAGGRFTVRSHGSRRHRARVTYAHMVAVKTSACGIAVAPPFTASRQPGGYIVKASARPARSAAFALVNEAPGQSQ